jgi:DtxR family Mn-dependent transcriptional regulator
LTDAGRQLGRAQVRKHRLIERLLHGIIGRPWESVHDEACRFEHVMSDEVTESLDRALGRPATCPHGNPIPGRGPDDEADLRSLAECRGGQAAVVASVSDEASDLLKYLLDLGLLPGSTILVEQTAPFGGPLLIRVGEARDALGRDVAAKIKVRETLPGADKLTAPERQVSPEPALG